MLNHLDLLIFTPIFIASLIFLIYLSLKNRKRSAKSIYKLIDDLEKKYIY